MISRNWLLVVLLPGFASCGSEPEVNEDSPQEVAAALEKMDLPPVVSSAPEYVEPFVVSSSVRNEICKQAIAKLNGHSPSIMKVHLAGSNIVQIKYARPDDGKIWTNECRVSGDRVEWRTVNAFGDGSGNGRWRNAPYDEKVTFELRDGKPVVHVQY